MANRQQVGDFNPYKALQPSQQVTDQYITPGYFQMPQNEWIDIARSLSGLSGTLSEVTGNMQKAEVEAEIQQGTAQVDLMTEDQLDAALALQWRQAGLPEGASPLAQKSILSHAGSKKARNALEQFRISNLDRFSDPYSTEDPRAAMQQAFEQLGISGFYAGNAASAEFSKQANAFSEQVYQARAARTSKQLREDLTDNLSEALKGWRGDPDGAFDQVEELIGIGYSRHGIAGDVEFFNAFRNIYLEAREDQDPKAGDLLTKFESIKVGSATMGKRYASELYDLENAGDRAEESTERKERNDRTDQLLKASDAISVLIYENRPELAEMGAANAQNFIEDALESDETLDKVGVAKAMEQFTTLYAKAVAPTTDITDRDAFDSLYREVWEGRITVRDAQLQSLDITMSSEDLVRMEKAIKTLEDDQTNDRLRPSKRTMELNARGLVGVRDEITGELISRFYAQDIDLKNEFDARSRAANQLRLKFGGEVSRKIDSLISKHWDDEADVGDILSKIREDLDPWASERIQVLTEGVEAPARKGVDVIKGEKPKLPVDIAADVVAEQSSIWSSQQFPKVTESFVGTLRNPESTLEERLASFGAMEQASSDQLVIFRTPTATNPDGVLDYTFRSDGIHKSVKKLRRTGPRGTDFKYITQESPQPDENLTKHYFLARSFAEPLTIEELQAGETKDGVGITTAHKNPKRYLFVNNRVDLESMVAEYDLALENNTPVGETRVGALLIALGTDAGLPADFFRYQSLQLGLKPADVKGSN